MKSIIKLLSLVLSLILSLSLLSACGAPKGDDYHDGDMIAIWEVESWVGFGRCYFPSYFTVNLKADGSAIQTLSEDQFKYNLQMEETFTFIIYPQMREAEFRNKFLGMKKDKYIEYLRGVIAKELPSRIESVYDMSMEDWLEKEYKEYKKQAADGKVSKGITYWLSRDGKIALLNSIDDFESKFPEDIWNVISAETQTACIAYEISKDGKSVTLSQLSDDAYRNSYPVTLTKIG